MSTFPGSTERTSAGPTRDSHIMAANQDALQRMFNSEPALIDVQPALEVLPGMTQNTILTSGPLMAWAEYAGGQRRAIAGAAVYEGLAADIAMAEQALAAGDIAVGGCHDFACVGSLAGATSASMPVLVVEDVNSGRRGHCTLLEGATRARLNYGVWNDDVAANLNFLGNVLAPSLGAVLRSIDGGVRLRPIIQRAVTQGDELLSRTHCCVATIPPGDCADPGGPRAAARDEADRVSHVR